MRMTAEYGTGRPGSPRRLTKEEAAQIVAKALELLATADDWVQGRLTARRLDPVDGFVDLDNDSPGMAAGRYKTRRVYCLVGAIREAMAVTGITHGAIHLDPHYRVTGGLRRIEDWNDDPHRTFADVKAHLVHLYEVYAGQPWEAHAGSAGARPQEGEERSVEPVPA